MLYYPSFLILVHLYLWCVCIASIALDKQYGMFLITVHVLSSTLPFYSFICVIHGN